MRHLDPQDCFVPLKNRLRPPSDSPDRYENHLPVDRLTGLATRLELIRDISVDACPVLFLINVEDFSQINNHFGLDVGDAVLKILARRLAAFARGEKYQLYKLPADEFALLGNIAPAGQKCSEMAWVDIPWAELSSLADKVIDLIGTSPLEIYPPQTADHLEIDVRVTIGIAVARVVGRENLITHADMARRSATAEKRPYRYYKQSTAAKKAYARNIRDLQTLRLAMQRDRIVPFFQPIRNNRTGRVEKYEALARLGHNRQKVLAPDRFLQLARVTRAYPRLSRRVIAKALEHMQDKPYGLSINSAIDDIHNRDLVEFLMRALPEHRNGPQLTFEILESEAITRYAEIKTFIERFKRLGCKFAIDDFGSGYSHFMHLTRLPIDLIKIDRSLIAPLTTNANSRLVVEAIVGLARKLGLQTVAEGVDNDRTDSMVNALGIHFTQGFLIGMPQPTVSHDLPGKDDTGTAGQSTAIDSLSIQTTDKISF